jgi:ligand-binding sensor domain-containing protein
VGKDHSGINRIIRDDQNNLWIGFDGFWGIVKYDHTHNRAGSLYDYEDGTSARATVSSMTFDKKGRLWIGHTLMG